MKKAISLFIVIAGLVISFFYDKVVPKSNLEVQEPIAVLKGETSKSKRNQIGTNKASLATTVSVGYQDQTSLATTTSAKRTTTTTEYYPRTNSKFDATKMAKANGEAHPLAKLFEQTAVPSQFFEIDATASAVLKTENGSMIAIPNNGFITAVGDSVKGQVELEVKEVVDMTDLLLSNLSSVSAHNNVLVSEGVLYVDAKSNGKQVQLAPDKQIYVEYATEKKDGDMIVSNGQYAETGEMAWSNPKRLISTVFLLPPNNLNFEQLGLAPELLAQLQSPAYEQSIVATREFEERLHFIQATQEIHDHRTGPILDFFFKNPKSSLLEIDHKLQRYFDRLLTVEPYQNGQYVAEVEMIRDQFQSFYETKVTLPEPINSYGIDLNNPNAFVQLRALGVGSKRANHLIHLHQIRQYLIETHQTPNASQGFASTRKYSFFLDQTGWYNVDKFYEHTKPKQGLTVTTNFAQNACVYLLFDDFISVVPAKKDWQDSFQFRGLPYGETAKLVAIAYQNEQPYFDTANVTIGSIHSTKLALQPTTIDQLKYQISSINL
ncbi:MAG: hypothetical protein ACPGXL_02720 [Chitinophagales bacterium]